MGEPTNCFESVLIFCLAMATLLSASEPALADSQVNQAATLELRDVVVGFDGRFKVGYWTPVYVTVVNQGEPLTANLELETVDGDAVTTRYINSEFSRIELGSHESARVTAYARFGRIASGLILRLRDEQQVLAETTVRFNGRTRPGLSTSELVVMVGNDIGIGDALNLDESSRASRTEESYVVLSETAELPEHWIGYESVDTLVVTTRGSAGEFALGQRTLQAIATWVRLGGRLILCVGQNGDRLLAEPGPLSSLVPGRFAGTAVLSSAAGLETYVRATSPLDIRRQDVNISVLKDVRGMVEAFSGPQVQPLPIIIRSSHGLGHVVFVAVDLDLPIFAGWADRPRLVANLLSQVSPRARREESEFRGGRASHVGYQDMTGQLRAALDQFDEVRPLAFSAIAAMVFAYILLIGPGDYFFLKKLVRRMEWTWLSFLFLAAGFCGLVFLLIRVTQSDDVHLNYVEVIDIDAESRTLRGTAWGHIYSPVSANYDLTFDPRIPLAGKPQDVLLSWNGLPGRGLNAMDTGVPTLPPGDDYVSRQRFVSGSLQSRLRGLPIQTSSSKTLLARWWATLDMIPPSELRKDRRDGALRGEFTNPLDVELSDCVILYGSWAYRLDRRLAAGETIRVEDELVEKAVEGFLNDRRIVESQDLATPWNVSSSDVQRIIEVMLFYKKAGGASYTGLSLAYQDFIDLSDQIEAGRAVVFAKTNHRFGSIKDSGKSMDEAVDEQGSWTFVRIVLPVEETRGAGR